MAASGHPEPVTGAAKHVHFDENLPLLKGLRAGETSPQPFPLSWPDFIGPPGGRVSTRQ
jgi:hypothetical protein